jgi:hypothetical protein
LLIVVDTVIKLPWTIFLKSATEAVWIASYQGDDNEFYPQLAGFPGAGHSENLGRRACAPTKIYEKICVKLLKF